MHIDIFKKTREAFDLPSGMIYLDGNSLGPLSHAAKRRVTRELETEWGGKLVSGWNQSGWFDLPKKIGDRIAALIGAPAGSVLVADSTSVNLYKVLTSALRIAGAGRNTVLSDNGNFPSDLYVAEQALSSRSDGPRLKIVEPEAVYDALDRSVAVMMLTEVDYRTGRLHDMAALTARARDAGAITVWDVAHSAGAIPVALERCGVDFAIGCSYKYLNGGPGAPAFVYVRPDLQDQALPDLAGWMGHAAPFDFDVAYRPAPGMARFRVGTPPILSMSALDAALDVWDGLDIGTVRKRSIELSERFIAEIEARCPMLSLASPRDPERRGSQVSFRFHEGYRAMRATIDAGVVGDFRAPDIMRFGFTPLYISEDDVIEAARRIEQVMRDERWRDAAYAERDAVT